MTSSRLLDVPMVPWSILCADALEGLAQIADGSIHTVVTSPPYWAQRRYNAGPKELGSEATSACGLQGMMKLRADLTEEQVNYVLTRLGGLRRGTPR